jgi:hypothetical protein
MNFLNSAFDSSTFIRTNFNYLQSIAHPNLSNSNSVNNNNNNSTQNTANNTNNTNNGAQGSFLLNQGAGLINRLTSSNNNTSNNNTNNNNNNNSRIAIGSIVLGGGSGVTVNSGFYSNNNQQPLGNSSNLISSCNNLITTAKSSICTNYLNGSVSSKTAEGRALWLQNLANAAAYATSKRAYCSKTQLYCEALSRSLDIQTTKVIPFFGAFLHDLRFIIESVPSVTVLCNKNIQKPIEVSLSFSTSLFNRFKNYKSVGQKRKF